MFRAYRFSVKGLLKERDNLLEVHLVPVMQAGAAMNEAYGIDLPADNDEGEPKASPFVRKAGYHFGWDFVPRTLPTGIWQPVELHAWSGARIRTVRAEQTHFDDHIRLVLAVELEGQVARDAVLKAYVDGVQLTRAPARSDTGVSVILTGQLSDTLRWWPNGSGAQRLRKVRVDLMEGGRVKSTWERAMGMRTVALDQSVDSIGTRFTFVVNGRPLFMKGANVVPPDVYLPRAGDAAWVTMVHDMQAIGVNMVRVWGGGVYPPDAFFDACDTAGILVWQDLMFANAMYPGDEAFRKEVEAEVCGQVERLRHHASLALWCGNNEVEVAWHNWGWQGTYGLAGPVQERIWNDHLALFHGLIPATIAALDDRPYVPTSPLSNWGNAKGLRHGSLHYWGVWHGDEPLEAFARNVGRFVSEWGFQSYPDMEVLARSNHGQVPSIGTPFWASRQRSYKGDAAIRKVTDAYGLPSATAEQLVRSSQWCQAHGYALAIAAQRMAEPHCMGTLFWQWNDVWPGASWSVVGHDGRRKPAFSAVANTFADTLLWLDHHEGAIRLRLRRWDSWDSMAVHLRLFHADGRLIWADSPILRSAHLGMASIHAAPPGQIIAAHDPAALILFADLGPALKPARYQRWLTWVPPGRFKRTYAPVEWRTLNKSVIELTCPVPQPAIYVEGGEAGATPTSFSMAPDRVYSCGVKPGQVPVVGPMW